MNWFNKHKNKLGLLGVLVFIQMILINPVLAQGIGFAAPGADDLSRSFLNQIFGDLLDNGSNAFGRSISVFNGAILTIGGILAAYTILAGTIGTAHDGEMLGKKFSSIWIPVRYALGTALVLPVVGSGYCVMQTLVMWIIMQGVSLANLAWSEYAKDPPALKAPISTSTKAIIKKFVEDVYIAQVCVEANQKAYTDKPPILARAGLATFAYSAKRVDIGFGKFGWQFGDHGGKIGWKKTCGSIDEPKKPEIRIDSFSTVSDISAMRGLENAFKVVDLTPIYSTHVQQIQKIVEATGLLAKTSILKEGNSNYSSLQALTDAYITALDASTTGVARSQTNLQNSASQRGWFMAGTWVTKIIFAQNKINSMANQTGTTDITIYKNTDSTSDNVARLSANGYSLLVEQRPEITGLALNPTNNKDEKSPGNAVGLGGIAGKYLSNIVVGINLEDIKNDTRHPLIVMVRVGDGILGGVLAGISAAAIFALAAGTTVLGNGTGVTAATFILFSTLAGPFLVFIGTGAMLTFILPNLPFMLWMGVIIGWTIMTIEAVIAAPLWAIMHLHPNGDDLTGRGGNGYMLVLGLLLRPVLIIFGLIASIVLSELFGNFVNRVFFDVFSSNMGDSGVGFFGMIFGTGIYAAIMMTVIKQTFNLMHVIPDQLMRWVGGGGEQLGQYAGGFSGDGMAKAAAVGGAVMGLMAKDTIGTGSSAVGQMNQIKVGKENKVATENQTKQDLKIAEASSEKAQTASDNSFNQGIGSSDNLAGEINASFANQNQLGEFNESRAQKEISNAQTEVANNNASLGGNGSEAAETYKSELSNNMKNGQSFDDANSNALSTAADEKFGAGAGDAIKQLGAEGQSASKTLSSLNAKQNNIQEQTGDPSDTRSTMSNMFSRANNILKSQSNTSDTGPIQPISSFSQAMKSASSEVNKNLFGRTPSYFSADYKTPDSAPSSAPTSVATSPEPANTPYPTLDGNNSGTSVAGPLAPPPKEGDSER